MASDEQLRIVHVVRQFHPAVGGLEGVVFELAAAQVAEGHSVRVVTLDRLFNTPASGRLPPRDRVAGAEVVRIPFIGSTRYPIAPSVLLHLAKADVVHVHGIDFFCDFLAWTKPLHRKRLVVSTHGGFFHTQFAAGLKRLYFATVTRLTLRWYDATVAVSAADRDTFATIRPRRLECIENGVNIVKFADAASIAPAKCVLVLGRLSSNKRIDRVIGFFAALYRRDPQWRLIVAGREWDVDAASLKALAEREGVADAVEVITDPSDREIRELMARCSVFACASAYEGFGLAAVEALSAGLFPLLSDIPAFRRLHETTKTGMLIDFADSDDAAERFLRQWPEIAAHYPAWRAHAMQQAARYDWKHVAAAYARVYETVGAPKNRAILGVPISANTREQAVNRLDSRFESGDATLVAFANAHTLNVAVRDRQFRAVLQRSLVLNDGVGVDLASRLLYGAAFPANLNGTDFTPFYLQQTRHCFRIFLLGGRPGVALRAERYFADLCPQHRIVGSHHGYFAGQDAAIVAAIKSSKADVVIVAMGNPLQERWLAENLAASGARLGFAVGALFDFVTGDAQRAPQWARSLRLEWIYRLAQEPRRLAARYLIGNPLFVLRVTAQLFAGSREASPDLPLPSSPLERLER